MSEQTQMPDPVIAALLAESERTGVHPRDILPTLRKRLRPFAPPRWTDGENGGYNSSILRGKNRVFNTPAERNEWFRHQVDDLGRDPREVAEEFGVCTATVRKHTKLLQESTDRWMARHLEEKTILAIYEDSPDITMQALAKQVGCTPMRARKVTACLREHNRHTETCQLCPLPVVLEYVGWEKFRIIEVVGTDSTRRKHIMKLVRWQRFCSEDPSFPERRWQRALRNGQDVPRFSGILVTRKSMDKHDLRPLLRVVNLQEITGEP